MSPYRWPLAAALTCAALAGCSRPAHEEARAPVPPPARTAAAPATAPSPQSPATVTAHADPRDVINDTVITTRIKAGILSDPGMAGSDVSVNTDRGVVSLTGVIKSQEQAAIASAHASRQDGVMRVDNHLAVNLL